MEIPRTKPLPDEFFSAVADAYTEHASTKRPAAVIANEWGVNPRRVHRWFSECRNRGLLPEVGPGRVYDGTTECDRCHGTGRMESR